MTVTNNQQQTPQFPPEVAQQLKIIQTRANTADLATLDLRNEINSLLRLLLAKLDELQKENIDLKATLETASKP